MQSAAHKKNEPEVTLGLVHSSFELGFQSSDLARLMTFLKAWNGCAPLMK